MTAGPLAEGPVSFSSRMTPSFEEALHRLLQARLKLVLILGFIVALAVLSLVIAISQRGGKIPVETFLLAGVVVGSFMWRRTLPC